MKRDSLGPTPHVMSLTSPATELGTRAALARIMSNLDDLLPPERVGIVEIALAEILNNIVEHAYAGTDNGEIDLNAWIDGTALCFEIQDYGAPLPGLTLPPGQEHDLTGPRDSLPEGGFGWMLIRSMARALDYQRKGDTNTLRVAFETGAA